MRPRKEDSADARSPHMDIQKYLPSDLFHGKTVFVTGMFVIAAMCASVQLTGVCAPCCLFEEPVVEDHGHDDHHH